MGHKTATVSGNIKGLAVDILRPAHGVDCSLAMHDRREW